MLAHQPFTHSRKSSGRLPRVAATRSACTAPDALETYRADHRAGDWAWPICPPARPNKMKKALNTTPTIRAPNRQDWAEHTPRNFWLDFVRLTLAAERLAPATFLGHLVG
jgi:hypothetical protein